MGNAIFIIIVFLLTLNKDKIFLEWPFGIKENITFNEETFDVSLTLSFFNIISFQALIAAGLKELRDKSVFFFAMFNALFVLIVFMLTLNKDILHIDWPFGVKENITITEDSQVGQRRIHA